MTRAHFAAVPFAGVLLGKVEQSPANAATPYVFARREFEHRAGLPFRHRQVFAARGLGSGVVLHLMLNSLKAYNTPGGFGEGPRSLHAAAVLYGTSIAALLDDAAWQDLQLAAFLQRLGELPAGEVKANPYSDVVADLDRAQASFFICNNALHDVAGALTGSPKTVNADSNYAALRRGLKPIALVVPAGVAAINALAEYHFSLIQATV